MSFECLIYANPNGKYVCRDNVLRVHKTRVVRAANLPAPVAVSVSVTGDVSGPFSAMGASLENGVDLMLSPGTYRFDFDCADYAGTAPADPVTICYHDAHDAGGDNSLLYQKMCQLIASLNQTSEPLQLAALVTAIEALCQKILDAEASNNALLIEVRDRLGTSTSINTSAEQCYCWTVGDTTGEFMGYVVTNSETGDFIRRVVTSGSAPPAGATVVCAMTKYLKKMTECDEADTICGNTWVDCNGDAISFACLN